jgi:hypothetical protein
MKKYKYETIETLVPYENTETPILKVDGVKVTRYAKLDVLHETKRYTHFAIKKGLQLISGILVGIINILDELVVEFNKEFNHR